MFFRDSREEGILELLSFSLKIAGYHKIFWKYYSIEIARTRPICFPQDSAGRSCSQMYREKTGCFCLEQDSRNTVSVSCFFLN